MQPLITPDLVALDANLGDDKNAVIRGLVERLAAAGRASDVDGLVADVLDREGKASTGLPGGIAIPHCRSEHVTTGSLGFARLDPPVDFGADDGDADLVFLIAAAADGDADHMKLLTKLARALVRKDFTQSLRDAQSVDEVVALVSEVVAPDEPAATSSETGAATLPPAPTPTPRARVPTPRARVPTARHPTRPRQPVRPERRLPTVAGVRWSPSRPARPGSPTPTWRPTRWPRPRRRPASTCTSRRRALRAPRR